MYKVVNYHDKIHLLNAEALRKYALAKELSNNFNIENQEALELDKHLMSLIESQDDEENSFSGVKKNTSTDTIRVPEINLHYSNPSNFSFPTRIKSAEVVVECLKEIIGFENLPIQEHFIVLYMNQRNEIIGYYRHSKGGIQSTIVDLRLIFSIALKCLAVGIILCHNHPGGGLNPSEQDNSITGKAKRIASDLNITILDHIIVTTSGHYYYASAGLMGLQEERPKEISIVEDGKSQSEQENLKLFAFKSKALQLKWNKNKH